MSLPPAPTVAILCLLACAGEDTPLDRQPLIPDAAVDGPAADLPPEVLADVAADAPIDARPEAAPDVRAEADTPAPADQAEAEVPAGPPPASICLVNSDCDNPLVCEFGRCHVQCLASRDCPLGQSCVKASMGRVCLQPQEATCVVNSDCPFPLVCAPDRRCRNQCQLPNDCTPGQTCFGGTCSD